GLLMRSWFRPTPRPAEDVDLVAVSRFPVEEAARRFTEVFSDDAIADGGCFDTDEGRAEGIWVNATTPGGRVFATGLAEGLEIDFHVDVTFGPPPRPAAVFGALPTACGTAARVWVCRPEAIAGHKVQALWYCGALGWRPKDLNDLRLLTRVPMDDAALR